MAHLSRWTLSIMGWMMLICLTGCSPEDITLTGHELAPIIGEHVHSVNINPDDVLKLWHLNSVDALRSAAANFASSAAWERIKSQLDEFRESDGRVRDALIEAACESARTGKYSYADYKKNLEDAFFGMILKPPITKQLLDIVNQLSVTLYNNVKEGSSAKATVAIGCAAYSTHSLLSGS